MPQKPPEEAKKHGWVPAQKAAERCFTLGRNLGKKEKADASQPVGLEIQNKNATFMCYLSREIC